MPLIALDVKDDAFIAAEVLKELVLRRLHKPPPRGEKT